MADKIYDVNEHSKGAVLIRGKNRNIKLDDLKDIVSRENEGGFPSVAVYHSDLRIDGEAKRLSIEVDDGEIYRAWLLREDEYIEAKVSRVT